MRLTCEKPLPAQGICGRLIQEPKGPCGILHERRVGVHPARGTGRTIHLAHNDYAVCGARATETAPDGTAATCSRCSFWVDDEGTTFRDPGSLVRETKGGYPVRHDLRAAGAIWDGDRKLWIATVRQLDAVTDARLTDGWVWFPINDVHDQHSAFFKDITSWTPQRRSANYRRWKIYVDRRTALLT